ncbi:hypothetical protein FD12_GL001566 [Lentilactobacillus rapi DSM 19907 = JCM 15042]|uniref:Uncharacterized protein n=3 Tax=Lactobacillaceae TaxID=33958 RepID=A0A0R2FEZ9_9LACO|nr:MULTISPECIES: hypothetical protein [Lactobacillaceae]KRL17640.1 hypothetical protein FD12_GL001566 [Lentilactobacillus rapi DSM 19907 = JCM 15042]KRN27169.1 hypothetical protein IV38_GL000746 [Lactobacillus selangorensis]GEP72009.1 hypothetical protein LRA02_08770 [Lentilactobacillus rapi]
MTDEDYFDWWHTARQARRKYPFDKDQDVAWFDMPFPLLPEQMTIYPGDKIRDRKLIEIFLDEYNRRHHTHMTVDEYLK